MHSSISIVILSLFTVKKNNAHVMENKVSIVIFDCIYIYICKYLSKLYLFINFFLSDDSVIVFFNFREVLVDEHFVFPSCNQDAISPVEVHQQQGSTRR